MGTFWILVSLIIFVCILLVLVVMVQNPKGGGLSSTFGGGQQQIGGVKSTTIGHGYSRHLTPMPDVWSTPHLSR